MFLIHCFTNGAQLLRRSPPSVRRVCLSSHGELPLRDRYYPRLRRGSGRRAGRRGEIGKGERAGRALQDGSRLRVLVGDRSSDNVEDTRKLRPVADPVQVRDCVRRELECGWPVAEPGGDEDSLGELLGGLVAEVGPQLDALVQ